MVYTETIEEDENGDLIVKIPDEILIELGWKEGDELDISLQDGYITLRKIED